MNPSQNTVNLGGFPQTSNFFPVDSRAGAILKSFAMRFICELCSLRAPQRCDKHTSRSAGDINTYTHRQTRSRRKWGAETPATPRHPGMGHASSQGRGRVVRCSKPLDASKKKPQTQPRNEEKSQIRVWRRGRKQPRAKISLPGV